MSFWWWPLVLKYKYSHVSLYYFCDDEEWGGASDWVISSVHPISFQLLHSSLNTKRPRLAMTMILIMVFVIMILMTITMILIMAIIFVSDQKIFEKVLVCTDLKHTNVLFIKVFGLFLNSSTALFTFRIQYFFFLSFLSPAALSTVPAPSVLTSCACCAQMPPRRLWLIRFPKTFSNPPNPRQPVCL